MSLPLFLSQTECNDWSTCHLRAWARHVLGYRHPDDESMPQRVGSIGHALVREHVEAAWYGRERDDATAVAREAQRRKWIADPAEDAERAAPGAAALVRELRLDAMPPVPDLYSVDANRRTCSGPLAERRIAVPWSAVASEAFGDQHVITACPSVRERYAGMEGTPDLVMMPEGFGGPVVVVDYKFRQKPDLGGAATDPMETVPNRQAAWYLVLLRAAGLHSASGFEFWQANVFAGRRLAADDFIRAGRGLAESVEEADLVIRSGLPTCDLKRIGACGRVSAEEWAEAHRALANLRHDQRMAEWRSAPPPPAGSRAKPRPPPERLSAAEESDARRMLVTLRAQLEVAVRKVPADPYVCREVVRDMIVGVEAGLSMAMRGMTPARNLQDHRGSNCVRPYGCPIQTPCRATIGTWNIRRTLEDMHAAGQLAHVVGSGTAVAPFGNHPSDAAWRLLGITEETQ